jgi:fructose-bisphosphate aldolase class II
VILNIAEVHFPFVNLEVMCPAVLAAARRASVPVALNLDHGQSVESVFRAVANGFTSVMIDASRLPYGENVALSAEVVRLCRTVDVTVEAELGAVGGNESGGMEAEADPGLFTDPDQAADFVRRTGIDALAVAVGNAHGRYKGAPKLDFDRLAGIREKAGIPLVLHGGSGIPDGDFRRAVGLGIAKINFYTGMSEAALAAVSDRVKTAGAAYHDFPLMMQEVRKRVAETVARQIDVFGSAGKA